MTRQASGSYLSTVASLLCLALAACAVEKNHRVLSFFFDGVPDPNAPQSSKLSAPASDDRATLTAAQRSAMLGRQVVAPEVTFHPPVKERNCQGCHKGGEVTGNTSFSVVPTLLAEPPELCWRCHQEPEYAYGHGPSAAGACLICHLPHQSLHKHLLPMPEAELCGTCHVSETFVTEDRHVAAGAQQCTQCHDPHGAERPYLLRSQAPASLDMPASDQNSEDEDADAPDTEPGGV